MNQIKLKKIGSEINRAISDILANEARDSILKTITVTGVNVSNDLSYAKVYFTSLSDIDSKGLEKELAEAAGYIRKNLSERINIRHTPMLTFIYDESIKYGKKIENIIKEIHSDSEWIFRWIQMIINVNKPAGMTSRDVVNICNRIFETKKVGHTGTLDPIATGVLLICTDKDTKLVDMLTAKDKEYIATIKLGTKTDTGDITGTIIEEKDFNLTEEQIIIAMNSFVGTYDQEVPIYSSVKINGKKLYQYARNNEHVELPRREVTIKEIELLEFNQNEITFKTLVSKGTYIRSLINDICSKLNTVGTMTGLIRTKQGSYSIEASNTIEDLESGTYNIISRESILNEYPKLEVSDELLKQITNGALIPKTFNSKYIVYTNNQEIIAIYMEYPKDSTLAKPYIMF